MVLCRHGSTAANAAGRFLSRTDPALDARGRAQGEALRSQLAGYALHDALVSPAKRCLETAALALPGARIDVRAGLREIDFGTWEGRTLDELRAAVPEQVVSRERDPVEFRPDGGESFRDLAARLEAIVRELESGEGDRAVVAHRGTLAVLERLLRRLDLRDRSVAPMAPGEFRVLHRAAEGFTSRPSGMG